MRILVTGCAGFIGSSLAQKLLAQNFDVLGVDCFTDYYARRIKQRNLAPLLEKKNFRFIEKDIVDVDVKEFLGSGDAVFHEAAQAGVRASWGDSFRVYTHHNIAATQRLLEGVKDIGLARFVYAGSSSVYGDALKFPTRESDLPAPVSPYGVTKLAAEHLCRLYHVNYGVPSVSVRYFTVFGPKQRPDMAFHKWCLAALTGKKLPIFGDGEQTRDFTYVDDAVDATIAAMTAPKAPGEVMNIGGGNRISVNGVLDILARIHGGSLNIVDEGNQKGDVRHTCADVTRAKELLGYDPKVGVEDGLAEEYKYIKSLYGL